MLMLGGVFLLLFPLMGAWTAFTCTEQYPKGMALYLGAVAGTVCLIWLPALWALALGSFSVWSYWLAFAVYFLLCAACIFMGVRRNKARTYRKGSPYPSSFYVLGALFLGLMAVLFVSHVLYPKEGGYWGGQCTYGDLSMHLGFITSMAEQGTFPPEYNLLPGMLLSYPFLVDTLSAGMLLLGMKLAASVILPSLLLCAILYWGLYIFFLQQSMSHRRTLFCLLLFFLCGGLGVFYYLDGSAADKFNFMRMFTEYYNAPTNFPEDGLRWVNPICDMILPQRTTLLGWSMAPAVFCLVQDGLRENRWRSMLFAGILAGTLPMMHTHTYLAVGVICLGWGIAYWIGEKDGARYVLRWVAFGVPALVLAIPQLFFWTFRQATGEAFVRIGQDWVNQGDPSWWFWLKNLGLTGFLLLPALWAKRREYLRLQSGAWLLWILCLFVLFQPNPYDNNKLMYVAYLLFLPAVAHYLEDLWHALKPVPGRQYLAAAALLMLFASGTLSIVREIKSGGEYLLYGEEEIALANFVKENTRTDDLFVTGRQHLNPVAVLAGRNVYCGADLYLYWHGLDTTVRAEELQWIYTDGEQSRLVAEGIGADYILLTDYERSQYPGCSELLSTLYKVAYTNGRLTLYRVNIPAQ